MTRPERLQANLRHLREAAAVNLQLRYAREIKYKEGLRLDDYHQIMAVLSRQRYFDEVVQILRLMRYRCVDPDLEAFHLTLRAFHSQCHMRQAERVFRDLQLKHTPTLETHRLMIECAGRAGNFQECKSRFDKLMEQGREGEDRDSIHLALLNAAIAYIRRPNSTIDARTVRCNEIYDVCKSVKLPHLNSETMIRCHQTMLLLALTAERWRDAAELAVLLREHQVEFPPEWFEKLVAGLKASGQLMDFWQPDERLVDRELLQEHLQTFQPASMSSVSS